LVVQVLGDQMPPVQQSLPLPLLALAEHFMCQSLMDSRLLQMQSI
jgi:hypothetical protein